MRFKLILLACALAAAIGPLALLSWEAVAQMEATVESHSAPQIGSNATGIDSDDPSQSTCGCGRAESQLTAQEEGDDFVISVPADSLISDTAELRFVGTPGAFVDARDCAADGQLRPTQTAIVIDPKGDSSRRIEGVVTLSQNGSPFLTELPNGTALGNFRGKSDCTVQGVPYFRYTATVIKGDQQSNALAMGAARFR